ncbi:MAG: WD40/YVTN/BNR-like repeat-containing protein [Planctomycetota bacterium]|jgi:hypothetical protein
MLIATERTVFKLDGAGEQEAPSVIFEGEGVRRVAEAARFDVVALADGTIALVDGGETRRLHAGIGDSIESLLVLCEEPLRLLAGAEPPHIYHVRAEGSAARRDADFDALECRDQWHTPWGGPPAVRSLALTGDGWVYADIHVGSIMRSPDGGGSWEPVTPELHEDVHQVATCPAADERVYAQTARAFYVSEDRGDSWHHRARDLDQRYGRAVVAHPEDPDLVLATVSDGPHGDDVHGQLYRSEDAGRNWTHVAAGFPASTTRNIDTFHVAFSPGGVAWGVVGRTLYVGRERASEWATFWEAPERIQMLACRPR